MATRIEGQTGMAAHVKECQRDHRNLYRTVQMIRERGLFHPQSHRDLIAIEQRLLEHLEREEHWIYPALLALGADDPSWRAQFTAYQEQLMAVTMQWVQFLVGYLDHHESEETISQAFDAVVVALAERIRIEEEILFPYYLEKREG